jgi:hypothetical protein
MTDNIVMGAWATEQEAQDAIDSGVFTYVPVLELSIVEDGPVGTPWCVWWARPNS